jgi:hypothetical protein
MLVADRTVLTCAHVVAKAFAADMRGAAPTGETTVDFPGSAEAGPTEAGSAGARAVASGGVLASVDPGGWVPVDAPGGGDLALLTLAGDPPDDVRPATLVACGAPDGRMVQAYGHPVGLDAGVWGRATLVGYGGPGTSWVQVDGVNTTGRAITAGFSGAGVIDGTGRVIGLVVAEDTQPAARVAWMIPVEVCLRSLPGLARLPAMSAAHHGGRTYAADPTSAARGQAEGPRRAPSVADLQRLARALSDVPAMRDAQTRRHVIDAMRPEIAHGVPAHPVLVIEVYGLLRTCLDHSGGVAELMSALRMFAGDSVSISHVDDLIREIGLDVA